VKRNGSWTVVFAAVAFATAVVAARQVTPARDASGPAPPMRAGTASISGRVVADGPAAEPIRRVTVIANEQVSGLGARRVVTDDLGRFDLSELPAGRYLVSATKAAYLPTAYGVTKPMRPGAVFTGTAIVVQEGQRLADVTIRMTRGSVVAGIVRSQDGQPVRGVSLSLFYFRRAPRTLGLAAQLRRDKSGPHSSSAIDS
jgi:hypothetical protein